jgi:hypothetical protein
MEDYNRMISSRILGNVDGMIDNVPQPTMFGGKRQRDFVLPMSGDYEYPATLAVGHLNTAGMPRTLGGSFWTDFGEKEYLDEDHDQYTMEGGAYYMGQDGQIHSTGMIGADPRTWTPRNPRKVGGKFNLGKALKPVAPIAKELGMTLAKEGIKEGVKSYAKSGGRRRRKSNVLKSVGKAMGSVGRELAPVAREVFRDVIVPEGKRALRDYIRNMGKKPEGEEVAGGSKPPQSSSDKIRMMVGKNYKKFKLDRVENPSADLIARYGKKPRKPRAKKQLIIEDDEEMEMMPTKKARKPRAKKQLIIEEDDEEDMDGGALIRDFPREFHSSLYPPALASYTAGRDAFGRGRAKGGARGGARGAIVKEVMAKHGLSLPEASKFVKEHGLY